jgi:hypothetical protein
LIRRRLETAAETDERFRRVLKADVAWWRENGKAVRDPVMRERAWRMADALEVFFDRWERGETP